MKMAWLLWGAAMIFICGAFVWLGYASMIEYLVAAEGLKK